jgi:hypothetical protein
MRNLWIVRILVVAALLSLASVANADTLTTYTLQGLNLSDGGSITGQFTYDSTSQAVNNGYSNIQINLNDPNNFGPSSPIAQSLDAGSSPTQLPLTGGFVQIALTFGTSLNLAPATDAITAASFPSGPFDVVPTISLGSAVSSVPEINASSAPVALALVGFAAIILRGGRIRKFPAA